MSVWMPQDRGRTQRPTTAPSAQGAVAASSRAKRLRAFARSPLDDHDRANDRREAPGDLSRRASALRCLEVGIDAAASLRSPSPRAKDRLNSFARLSR
jgi:hypothetical protein